MFVITVGHNYVEVFRGDDFDEASKVFDILTGLHRLVPPERTSAKLITLWEDGKVRLEYNS